MLLSQPCARLVAASRDAHRGGSSGVLSSSCIRLCRHRLPAVAFAGMHGSGPWDTWPRKKTCFLQQSGAAQSPQFRHIPGRVLGTCLRIVTFSMSLSGLFSDHFSLKTETTWPGLAGRPAADTHKRGPARLHTALQAVSRLVTWPARRAGACRDLSVRAGEGQQLSPKWCCPS